MTDKVQTKADLKVEKIAFLLDTRKRITIEVDIGYLIKLGDPRSEFYHEEQKRESIFPKKWFRKEEKALAFCNEIAKKFKVGEYTVLWRGEGNHVMRKRVIKTEGIEE